MKLWDVNGNQSEDPITTLSNVAPKLPEMGNTFPPQSALFHGTTPLSQCGGILRRRHIASRGTMWRVRKHSTLSD